MSEIDPFITNKLIDDYGIVARDIGWMLYNRTKPMNIDELNLLGKMIIRALDEEYYNGQEDSLRDQSL